MKRMQLVSFLIAVVFLQVFIALPFLVDRLGGDYRTVGVLMGVNFFAYAGGSMLMHRFVNQLGQQKVLRLVFPSMALGAALLAFVPNLLLLFVVVVLLAIVTALFWTSMECLFSNQAQEGALLQSLTRFSLSWCVGDVFGAWLGTKLASVDIRVPFLSAAGFVLACWAVLQWLERTGGLARAYNLPAAKEEQWHGGERFLPATRTMFFFVCTVMAITFSFVPLIVTKESEHWGSVSSQIITVQPLVQAVVFVGMGRWNGWVHRPWILWACPLVMAAAAILLCLAASPTLPAAVSAALLATGLCLVGVAMGATYLVNLLYSLERPDTRPRNSGTHEALVGMGMTVGPVVAGLGAGAAGKGAGVFWAAAGLGVAGFIATQLVWVSVRRRAQT